MLILAVACAAAACAERPPEPAPGAVATPDATALTASTPPASPPPISPSPVSPSPVSPPRQARDAVAQCHRWPPFGDAVFTRADGAVICINGDLTSTAARRLAAVAIPPHAVVVVNSFGHGFIEDALDIAERILAAEADVAVDKHCDDLCADYVFVAGARKIVLDGATLEFLTGPRDDEHFETRCRDDDHCIRLDFVPGSDAVAGCRGDDADCAWVLADPRRAYAWAGRQTEQVIARQHALFKKAGVDEALILTDPRDAAAAADGDAVVRKRGRWAYGPDVLRDRFGVRGIAYFGPLGARTLVGRGWEDLLGLGCRPIAPEVAACG